MNKIECYIGQSVIVNRYYDGINSGEKGVIKEISGDYIGIDFGKHLSGTHRLSGLLKKEQGYYIPYDHLKPDYSIDSFFWI